MSWPRRTPKPDAWIERATKETVIVHTKTGRSMRGVLWEVHDKWLVLRDAELLDDHPDSEMPVQPIDGETSVHRDNLDFMQVRP